MRKFKLRDLREIAGKTVQETADFLYVSRGTYYGYEQGIASVNIMNIELLAECFGVQPIDVLNAAIATRTDWLNGTKER